LYLLSFCRIIVWDLSFFCQISVVFSPYREAWKPSKFSYRRAIMRR
jgi:hypothetical protein